MEIPTKLEGTIHQSRFNALKNYLTKSASDPAWMGAYADGSAPDTAYKWAAVRQGDSINLAIDTGSKVYTGYIQLPARE